MALLASPGGIHYGGTNSRRFEIDYNCNQGDDVVLNNNIGTLEIIDRSLSVFRDIKFLNMTAFGSAAITGNLTVDGTLDVQGSIIRSDEIQVTDKNITLGVPVAPALPSNTTANGGGITLAGGADGNKTIYYKAAALADNADIEFSWVSNQSFQLTSGNVFGINDEPVLSLTTLGSTVVSSSLTTLGTVTTGTWNASPISHSYGGTGITTLGTGNSGKVLAVNSNGTGYELKSVNTRGISSHFFIDATTPTPLSLAANTCFIIRTSLYNYSQVIFPTSAAIGDEIEVIHDSVRPVLITLNAGQVIRVNSIDSRINGVEQTITNLYSEEGLGYGGRGNVIRLKCIATNTTFVVTSQVGTWQSNVTLPPITII